MKNFLLRISAIFMSVVVLFSTLSFTVEQHFCGDFLVDTSFVGQAEKCDMNPGTSSKEKNNCCKDEVHQIDGQDELQKQNPVVLTAKQQKVIVAFSYAYYKFFSDFTLKKNDYHNFSPPDLERDILVLHQTFLI